jgi:hypothetical protein
MFSSAYIASSSPLPLSITETRYAVPSFDGIANGLFKVRSYVASTLDARVDLWMKTTSWKLACTKYSHHIKLCILFRSRGLRPAATTTTEQMGRVRTAE